MARGSKPSAEGRAWPRFAVAHTANDIGVRHPLVEHLVEVARLTKRFAEKLHAADEGHLAGLWHDLGKFNPEFQDYLRRCEAEPGQRFPSVDHKAAGALLALRHHLPIVSWLIHAHHGGLVSRQSLGAWLAEREQVADIERIWDLARNEGVELAPPSSMRRADPQTELETELLIRLLYSALVDADSLDTEAHYHPELASVRASTVMAADLFTRFSEGRTVMVAGSSGSAVDEIRERIYRDCLQAAAGPIGIYRLTVPTGGGKTLSGMGFALRHASIHRLERVIVAVPYITITEQTAAVYRAVFGGGDDVVLEHHSGAIEARGDDDGHDDVALWHRLSAENWDAPVVVTTTVQLFESLFSNKRSRLRKAHRLARSVIILDEAQALPPALLEPILDALVGLSRTYSTTVVLSTATQPAFEAIPAFRDVGATEIVPGYADDFRALARVRYRWDLDRGVGWCEVAEWMRQRDQCLAVVNTKRHATELLGELEGIEGVLHLSTLLCGRHRRDVLEEIQLRLAEGLPCRVVSTQVIEAGVDLDFPVVFRAVAPLDSVIQTAGRCNREGRLDHGEVHVFRPDDSGMPPGVYRQGAQITTGLAAKGLDLDDPETAIEYFRRWLSGISPDSRSIQEHRKAFDFPEVARRFRMIGDDTVDVAVAYGLTEPELDRLLEPMKARRPGRRDSYRALQPYLVSLRRWDYEEALRRGLAKEVVDGLARWEGHYDKLRGLVMEGFVPSDLIV